MLFLSYFNKYAYFYSANKITEYDYINQKIVSQKDIDFPYQIPLRKQNYQTFDYETPNYYQTVKVWFDDQTDRNFQLLYDELLEFTPTNIIKIHTIPLCVKTDRFHSKLINFNGKLLYVSGQCLFQVLFDQNYLTNRKISIKCLNILASEYVRIHLLGDHFILRDNANCRIYTHDPYGNIITQQTMSVSTNYLIIQDDFMITQPMGDEFDGPSKETVIIYLENNILQLIKGDSLQDCYIDKKKLHDTNCIKYSDIVLSHNGFRLSQYLYEQIFGISSLKNQFKNSNYQDGRRQDDDQLQALQTAIELKKYLSNLFDNENTSFDNQKIQPVITQDQYPITEFGLNDDFSNIISPQANYNVEETVDDDIQNIHSEVSKNISIRTLTFKQLYEQTPHNKLKQCQIYSENNKQLLQHLILQAQNLKLFKSEEINFGDIRQASADLQLWQCVFKEVYYDSQMLDDVIDLTSIKTIFQSHISIFWLVLLNINVIDAQNEIQTDIETVKLSQKQFPVDRCRYLMNLLLKSDISGQQLQQIIQLSYKNRQIIEKYEYFKQLFNAWNVKQYRNYFYQIRTINNSIRIIERKQIEQSVQNDELVNDKQLYEIDKGEVEGVNEMIDEPDKDEIEAERWLFDVIIDVKTTTSYSADIPCLFRLLQPEQLPAFMADVLGTDPTVNVVELIINFLLYKNDESMLCCLSLVHYVREWDIAILAPLINEYLLFLGLFQENHPVNDIQMLNLRQPRVENFMVDLRRFFIDRNDRENINLNLDLVNTFNRLIRPISSLLNYADSERRFTQQQLDFFNQLTPMPHFLRSFYDGHFVNPLLDQNYNKTQQQSTQDVENNQQTLNDSQQKQIMIFTEAIKRCQQVVNQENKIQTEESQCNKDFISSENQQDEDMSDQQSYEQSDDSESILSINSDNLSKFVQINPEVDMDQQCKYKDIKPTNMCLEMDEDFDLPFLTERYIYILVFEDLKKLFQTLLIKIASYYKYGQQNNKNIIKGNEISALLQNKQYMTAWNVIQILQEKVLGHEYNNKYAIYVSIQSNLDDLTHLLFQFEGNIMPKNNVSLLQYCALHKKVNCVSKLLERLVIYRCFESFQAIDDTETFLRLKNINERSEKVLDYKKAKIEIESVQLQEYYSYLQRGTIMSSGINFLYKDKTFLTAQLLAVYTEQYFEIWMQSNATTHAQYYQQNSQLDTDLKIDSNDFNSQIHNLTLLKKQLDWVAQAELYLIFAYPSQILTNYFDNLVHPYFNISFAFRRCTLWSLNDVSNLLLQRHQRDESDYFDRRMTHLKQIMANSTYTNVKQNTLFKFCKKQSNIKNYIEYLNYEDKNQEDSISEASNIQQEKINNQTDIFGRDIKEYKQLSQVVNISRDEYQIWYMKIIDNL